MKALIVSDTLTFVLIGPYLCSFRTTYGRTKVIPNTFEVYKDASEESGYRSPLLGESELLSELFLGMTVAQIFVLTTGERISRVKTHGGLTAPITLPEIHEAISATTEIT